MKMTMLLLSLLLLLTMIDANPVVNVLADMAVKSQSILEKVHWVKVNLPAN